jgi:alkane 1-monooxygenase
MASAAPTLESDVPQTSEVLGIWLRHLTSFYIPTITLLFLVTGPHPWYVGVAFMFPMMLAHQIDCSARCERQQRSESLPAWPFDLLVYGLAAMQFLIVAQIIRLFSVQGIFSIDMLMVFLIVGGCSGFSIITAHELIHRRNRSEQWLGRLLLCSVLYEHFYTEHLRGHHARVGTPDDPATAEFGESFSSFWRRTVPAQFRSAWRLEAKRLGDIDMRLFDARMLNNRVLHGLILEWGFALCVFAVFGFTAFFAFVLQAFVAVRLLEAVNYFEHWGLQRRTRRVQPVDSWDTHSWFTYYGLTGLSRHADHHAWPARPYQQLRVWEEAPLLPYGYIGMTDLVIGKNAEFQERACDELARRRLGPFAATEPDAASGDSPLPPLDTKIARERLAEAQAQHEAEIKPGFISAHLAALPPLVRRVLLGGGLLLAVTLGVQWEAAGEMSFGARLLLNAWIAAAFVASFMLLNRIQAKTDNQGLAWAAGLSLLALLGSATNYVI